MFEVLYAPNCNSKSEIIGNTGPPPTAKRVTDAFTLAPASRKTDALGDIEPVVLLGHGMLVLKRLVDFENWSGFSFSELLNVGMSVCWAVSAACTSTCVGNKADQRVVHRANEGDIDVVRPHGPSVRKLRQSILTCGPSSERIRQ